MDDNCVYDPFTIGSTDANFDEDALICHRNRALPWGILSGRSSTGEQMALLDFLSFLFQHFWHPTIRRLYNSGHLRIVYDNSIAEENARGGWVASREGAIGYWLRKGGGSLLSARIGARALVAKVSCFQYFYSLK